MRSRKIIVGARGSLLSITQAEEVIALLKTRFSSCEFIFKTIITKGDKLKGALPREKGLFVKEIENALLEGEIDLAVHSLKDMPAELPPELVLGAVTERREPFDVFISKNGTKLNRLKKTAVIGTSSLRRKAQLLFFRGDFKVVNLRGNIDTRLNKVKEPRLDGIICALCAVKRLGIKNLFMEKLSIRSFLPAPGQGSLGIEVRSDDKFSRNLAKKVDHLPSHICGKAERDFLQYLGGGCRLPLAAYAVIKGDDIKLEAFVSKPDASSVICLKETVPLKDAGSIGAKLARLAVKKGASAILEAIE